MKLEGDCVLVAGVWDGLDLDDVRLLARAAKLGSVIACVHSDRGLAEIGRRPTLCQPQRLELVTALGDVREGFVGRGRPPLDWAWAVDDYHLGRVVLRGAASPDLQALARRRTLFITEIPAAALASERPRHIPEPLLLAPGRWQCVAASIEPDASWSLAPSLRALAAEVFGERLPEHRPPQELARQLYGRAILEREPTAGWAAWAAAIPGLLWLHRPRRTASPWRYDREAGDGHLAWLESRIWLLPAAVPPPPSLPEIQAAEVADVWRALVRTDEAALRVSLRPYAEACRPLLGELGEALESLAAGWTPVLQPSGAVLLVGSRAQPLRTACPVRLCRPPL